MDLVTDEPFVRDLVGRVTELMVAVGVESIRRLGLTTALHIHDDFASLRGLFFSPAIYERIFLPAMKRMCDAFHAEGVKVIYGGEGRTLTVLPDLVAAGVDALCCLEPRAGVDVVELREQLGDRVVFFGSLCNTVVLPRGTKEEIRATVLREMTLAREGHSIVGPSHSVSGEVPPENLDYMYQLIREWAPYDASLPAR
jgi:uroporphyrinogen decarboxylase